MCDVVQSVVEEDYTIQCYDNDNLTRYTTSLSATYTQNFDFTGKFCSINVESMPVMPCKMKCWPAMCIAMLRSYSYYYAFVG